MIPMVDLKTQYAQIQDEIAQGFSEVLNQCAFILGPNVQAFEKEAAAYLGVRHAIGCASGTDALHLALLASGVGPGDQVITSAFTFIATVEAIKYIGAEPVFADIDPRTFNITPDSVEPLINSRTKAVLPVHLFGQPVDVIGLQALCERHGLLLIEDCAQSFGARVDGRQTGSFGAAGAFSFFPSKNLGCYGDGGMVATNDDAVADLVKQLRNHGSKIRYYHDVIGYNSRLDELQAVVLRVKLKRIDQYNAARRRAAHLYEELLAGLPLQTPYADELGEHVYHQYTLLCPERDAVIAALQAAQIASAIYYPVPLHKQNVFKEEHASLSLPHTEAVAAQCLSLPICSSLEAGDIRRIADVIRGVFAA